MMTEEEAKRGFQNDEWDKLTDRQQVAIRIATGKAIRSFNWWVKLYSGPRWLAVTVLFLRNLAMIALPFSLITWIVTLMTNPFWSLFGAILSALWRTLTFR